MSVHRHRGAYGGHKRALGTGTAMTGGVSYNMWSGLLGPKLGSSVILKYTYLLSHHSNPQTINI